MCVLCIGTFDGIHIGHRKLLQRVVEIADDRKLSSVVISYKDHPAFTLGKNTLPRMLCPSEIKEQELKNLGIEKVALLEFTKELSETSALSFLSDYIIPNWHPKVIVIGYDSHFGKNREGNQKLLEEYQTEFGYTVEYVEPLYHEDKLVSSSLIRECLLSARVREANMLLGRAYRMIGKVCTGTAQGRNMGFPTANLCPLNPHQLIPSDGIYLSRVVIDNSCYWGLTNIGKSPTLKKSRMSEVETYILDFDQSIYDTTIQVEILEYIREEKRFINTNELIDAMKNDLLRARVLIGEYQ